MGDLPEASERGAPASGRGAGRALDGAAAPSFDNAGLVRARLTSRLGDPSAYRLGWIVAPAGSGKTRLLAHAAGAFPGSVAWGGTPDPVPRTESAFVTWVWEAVSSAGAADGPSKPSSLDALVATVRTDGSPVLIVLDDVHLLEGSEAERSLVGLVERLPPTWRLLAASRVNFGPDLSRMRVSGEVVDIGPDDLRFRTWEVEELFRDVYREPLLPEDVAVLTRRTAGWAAYLQLFFLATSRKPQSERRVVLGTLQNRPRLVSQYLARHALGGLSPELQDFLLRTSVLRRPSAHLCDEFLGLDGGSASMLAELERRQLFTEHMPDDSYRYHAVLLAYLDAKLVETLGMGAARAEHRRAAELLEREGLTEEALAAYARAEDAEGMGRILGQEGRADRDSDETLVDALPPGVVDSDALLLLVKARGAVARGSLAEAVQVLRRAESVAASDDVAERCRRLREQLLLWIEPNHPPQADWVGTLRRATQRRPLEGQRSAGAAPASVSRFLQGCASFLSGDMQAARRAMRAVAAQPDAPAMVCGAARLIGHVADGQTGRAAPDEETERSREEIEAIGTPWLSRLATVVLADSRRDSGQSQQALAEDLVGACERLGDSWGTALISYVSGLTAVEHGRPDALVLLLDAAECFRLLGAGVLEATALAYAGLAALAEGAEEQARTSAGRARTLSTVLEVPVASAVSSLTLGTLRRSPNDLGVARQILEPFGSWPWHARLLDRIDPSRPAATNPGSGPAGADRVAVPSSDPGHSGPAAATTGRTAGGGSHPDGPPPPMVLRGLGGFHLEVAGRAVDLSAAKPMERSLLQMLALRAGQGWHREELIEGLWPDADADAGVHRLQVAVSALRRIVGRGPEGEELIVRRSDSYLLHLPAGSRVDVVEFEQAVAEATAARNGGLDVLERQLLARAVSLYRGVLLPAVGPSDWVIGPRRRLVGEFGEVCIRLATLDLADNAPRRACRVARAGLDADRYRDELWKLLIGGAEQAGNHAEAEQARRDYEEVLHELGV